MDSAFLGVSRSALGRPWRARLDRLGEGRAEALVHQGGVSDILARVLAGRGVEMAALQSHLLPKLRDLLPDPSSLIGMDDAAERLARAVSKGERVAIFGDYDVDGACSAALLAGYLRSAGGRPRIHIPDRLIEGYGPNSDAIRMLASEGATLLVTVDCGTTSHEPLAEARRLGLDCVVLDHHQAPEALPMVEALVNPNRQDDLSGLGHLCAAGVVFVTLVATSRALRRTGFWQGRSEPDLLAELDLVALATVADVVPLTGLNRAFVRQGLAMMRGRARPGLAALIDGAGLNGPVEPWHLGFLIGPRINAGGRIGDAALGARLLLSQDESECRAIATELGRLNQERQEIERAAVAEAVAAAEAVLAVDPERPVLVAGPGDWHPGVVGLIAARLKERFRRPAFALALSPDGRTVTGSGRSVPGVDLGRAVRAAVEEGHAVKGGGHAMAAGVTLTRDSASEFERAIAERLAPEVASASGNEALQIDSILSAGAASPRIIGELEQAGPFGSGCPEPVFVLPAHRLTEATEVGAGGHVRVKLRAGDGQSLGGIAFRCAREPLGAALMKARGSLVHVAGHLTLSRWGGGERAELRVLDLAPAS